MIRDTAFSIDLRVMMSRGFKSRLTASTRTRADSAAEPVFSSSGLAIVDEYSKDMPSASNDDDIVLAVYMPPHEPVDGQAYFSRPSKSSCAMRPREDSPPAWNYNAMVRTLPFHLPALIVPPYT